MPLTLGWPEIAVRLVLSAFAGLVIGYNRGEHGRPAGLRTTLLVCLAAALAMIQMNLLLDVQGKNPSSFAVMDVMRLPLGILSGMGFIGGGAILRRENIVLGVTTAATLWYVTVMGLCIGGGQIGLGMAALALGVLILWGLKSFERHWKHEQKGTLVVSGAVDSPSHEDVAQALGRLGYRIKRWSVHYMTNAQLRRFSCEVHWQGKPGDNQPPAFVKELASLPKVNEVEWKPSELPT